MGDTRGWLATTSLHPHPSLTLVTRFGGAKNLLINIY